MNWSNPVARANWCDLIELVGRTNWTDLQHDLFWRNILEHVDQSVPDSSVRSKYLFVQIRSGHSLGSVASVFSRWSLSEAFFMSLIKNYQFHFVYLFASTWIELEISFEKIKLVAKWIWAPSERCQFVSLILQLYLSMKNLDFLTCNKSNPNDTCEFLEGLILFIVFLWMFCLWGKSDDHDTVVWPIGSV